jgi:hypothetical protein
VHAIDRIAHRHRPEGVAVVATANRQQARPARLSLRLPVLQRHLDRHFDRHRAGVAEKHVLQRLRRDGDQLACKADRRLMRQSAEHHVRHAAKLLRDRPVEFRMVVAVNRTPPRRHAVDQLAPVGEPEPHASRRRHLVAGNGAVIEV